MNKSDKALLQLWIDKRRSKLNKGGLRTTEAFTLKAELDVLVEYRDATDAALSFEELLEVYGPPREETAAAGDAG